MSVPSTWALTTGKALRASTAALTKKDMKPRATPCFFWKASLWRGPPAPTAGTSPPLEGVRMAAGGAGVDEAGGDALAEAAHALARLAQAGPGFRGGGRRRGRRRGGRRAAGLIPAVGLALLGRRRLLPLQVVQDVLLGDAALAAGAL